MSHQQLTDAELDKVRTELFPSWFQKKVLVNRELDFKIRNLGLGPYTQVHCYNGYHFHTRAYGANKSTTNSGVCVKRSGMMILNMFIIEL